MNQPIPQPFIEDKPNASHLLGKTLLAVAGAWLVLGCSGSNAEAVSGAMGSDAMANGSTTSPLPDGSGGPELHPAGPDVCGARGEVTWGVPESDGFVLVPPGEPLIRFGGRVDCSDLSAPAFAYPGASIALRFEGTALDVILNDHGTGTAQTTNYYDVSIDGADPTILQALPGQNTYPIARELDDSEHTLLIVKRTESGPVGNLNSGKGEFLGVRLPEGSELLPVQVSGRRLEFVGDSITCGYGNEISTDTPDSAHYTSQNSNANNAYGAITARLLNAEYTAVSYSGKGVSRNVSGDPSSLLPEIYGRSFPDDASSPLFPVANAVPDALVVNLGTNDFSPGGVDRTAYVESYIAFLETLRGYYPNAVFVCAVGPMLSDYYPEGEDAWTNIRADVQDVIAARAASGDTNIAYLEFAQQKAPYGEDWHPTVATHELMATQTAGLLQELLGW